jgi:HlyD family secretion protein
MLRRRNVIVSVLCLFVAVVGYAYWHHQTDEAEDGYVTEKIERGTIASTVTATGTVNPVSTVQVGTYVSGPIQALYVDYNSPVKKGQLVAKIDPAPFDVKVQQAEADVANARAKVQKDQADLKLKMLTLKRNQELRARNLISQNDVDTAKSNYDQAVAQLALDRASVQQTEAALKAAQINLSYTDITSPVDGVVVSRNVDVGQTVAASFQTPTLFLIAQDLTKMQVDTNVSESDIGDIRQAMPASFTVDAYPSKPFHGAVAQVRNAPINVQNVVTYDVVIAVDNPKLELKPGMTATVTITTAERDDVLRVPLRALRFHPERKTGASPTPIAAKAAAHSQPIAWVLQPDGTLKKVTLTTGVRDEQYAEIVSGDVHAGDEVAIAFKARRERNSVSSPFFGRRRH